MNHQGLIWFSVVHLSVLEGYIRNHQGTAEVMDSGQDTCHSSVRTTVWIPSTRIKTDGAAYLQSYFQGRLKRSLEKASWLREPNLQALGSSERHSLDLRGGEWLLRCLMPMFGLYIYAYVHVFTCMCVCSHTQTHMHMCAHTQMLCTYT